MPEKISIDKNKAMSEEGFIKSDKPGSQEGYLYAPGRAKIQKWNKKRKEKKQARKNKRLNK